MVLASDIVYLTGCRTISKLILLVVDSIYFPTRRPNVLQAFDNKLFSFSCYMGLAPYTSSEQGSWLDYSEPA